MTASRAIPTILTVLFAFHSAAAEPRWLRIRSANFELFTAAGERQGRDAILHFERVRSFFLRVSNVAPDSRLPVRIIAFRSSKEYKPYQLNEFATAYAAGGEDRDYIVMSGLGTEDYPVAVHEYMHLLQHVGRERLPIWLDEGMAELYSTLKPAGKKVEMGHVLTGRYQVLQSTKWLDLETLTNVGHDSPYYNKKELASLFYAESWALTHMLFMTESYRPKFGEFLAALSEGDQAAAFQRAYGKQMWEVWTDLDNYMRSGQFNIGVFDVQLEKSAEQPEIVEADVVERSVVVRACLDPSNVGTRRNWHSSN